MKRWWVVLALAVSLRAQGILENGIQRAPGAPVPTGDASIEGVVLNSVTHEPVKKANVMLMGPAALTASSDGSGHFAFRKLAAGQYWLTAQAPDYPERPSFGAGGRSGVRLAVGEQKSGVAIVLEPGASIAGRVRDEEGAALGGCAVSAALPDQVHGGIRSGFSGSASTNEKGEYRLANLAPGRYYILAQCRQTVPLPHAFLRRGPESDPPVQVYAPLFYPGNSDPGGAARVTASPGSNAAGIDFQMTPVVGVSLRGRVASDTDLTSRNVQVTVEAAGPGRKPWTRRGTPTHPRTGEFQIRNLLPGSYVLIALALGEGRPLYARSVVNVGAAPADPVLVNLEPTPSLSGRIELAEGMQARFESMQVFLNAVEGETDSLQWNARVNKDGSFVLTGFVPGKWTVFLNGAPGYVKSVFLNGQPAPGGILDIPAGTSGALKISVADRFGQVEGSVTDLPAETGPAWVLLWPADEGNVQIGLDRTINVDPHGSFRAAGVVPGAYRACAVSGSEPWMLLQQRPLLKVIEGRCTQIEIGEGERKNLQVPFVKPEDLERLTDGSAEK